MLNYQRVGGDDVILVLGGLGVLVLKVRSRAIFPPGLGP